MARRLTMGEMSEFAAEELGYSNFARGDGKKKRGTGRPKRGKKGMSGKRKAAYAGGAAAILAAAGAAGGTKRGRALVSAGAGKVKSGAGKAYGKAKDIGSSAVEKAKSGYGAAKNKLSRNKGGQSFGGAESFGPGDNRSLGTKAKNAAKRAGRKLRGR